MSRWLGWASLGVAVSIAFFHRTSPAVIADRLQSELGTSGASLGALTAAYFYVYAAVQLPAGLAVDVLGPRLCGAAGGAIAAAGAALFASVAGAGPATLSRAVVGFGCGLIFPSMVRFNATWFSEREFARVSGLAAVFGSLGGLLGTAPFALAVDAFGWRGALSGVAVLTAAVTVAGWLWVRDAPTTSAVTEAIAVDLRSAWRALRAVCANSRSWAPFFAFFGVYGSSAALSGTWGVPYLMQVHGLDRAAASAGSLLLSAGMAAGFPLIGHLADRIARRRSPWVVASAAACLAWVPLVFWPGGRPPLAAVFAAFLAVGLCSGAAVCIWATAREVNPPATAGTSFGLVNAGGFLGVSLLQPAMGWALDRFWQGQMLAGARVYPPEAFQGAFAIGLAAAGLALLGGLAATETAGRNIYATGP